METEKRHRIQVALWAYAYEVMNDPLAPDSQFDSTCRAIDLSIDTDRHDLDQWFRKEFDPSTGMWVHRHPDLEGVGKLYSRLTGKAPAKSQNTSHQTKNSLPVDPRRDLTGHNSHLMNMIYLASLGFNVVPGYFAPGNSKGFFYEFERDAMIIRQNDMEKRILYKDIFDYGQPIKDN